MTVIPFHEIAERAPTHDPSSCTRIPCRRCSGPHLPSVPRPVDRAVRPHVDRHVSPFDPLAPLLAEHAPDAPERLAELMLGLAAAITHHGAERWHRLLVWEKRDIGISLTRHEPVNDERPASETRLMLPAETEADQAENRRTGFYAQDARTAAAHLHGILPLLPDMNHPVKSDVLRLRFLIAVAQSRRPRQLKSQEIAAAQAATDGWCRSCFRVNMFEPVGLRPTGEPYYRDLCRWCGQNKGDQDQPTIDMVKIHHRIPVRKAS